MLDKSLGTYFCLKMAYLVLVFGLSMLTFFECMFGVDLNEVKFSCFCLK